MSNIIDRLAGFITNSANTITNSGAGVAVTSGFAGIADWLPHIISIVGVVGGLAISLMASQFNKRHKDRQEQREIERELRDIEYHEKRMREL